MSTMTLATTRIQQEPSGSPLRLIEAVALLYLEIEAGRRPASQLSRVLSPSVHRRLIARIRTGRHRGRACPAPDAVRAIHTCQPATGAIEASVVVSVAGRFRALAIRAERHLGTWRIVELASPEDGEAPRRTSSLTERAPQPDAFDEVLSA